MKQRAAVVWFLLAVLAGGVFLLAKRTARPGVGRIATTAPAADDRPQSAPDPERRSATADAPSGADDGATESPATRRQVDRLAGRTLVAFRVLVAPARPLVGAQLVVFRGDQLLADVRTDDRGIAELTADDRPATVVLAIPGRPLEQRDVALTPGRQDLVLDAGARVTGRFVPTSETTPGPLRIGVDSDRALPSTDALPDAVSRVLEARALRGGYSIVTTDADGRFELNGLPPRWSGILRLQHRWRVVSTSAGDLLPRARGIRIAAPVDDVVVRIALPATLRGRLVACDDRAPLGDARVAATLRIAETATPVLASDTTDADGRFVLDAPDESLVGLELRLGDSYVASPPILTLQQGELPADGDLGDVIVRDVRHVPFLALDERGAPIGGAVAAAAGLRSRPTGRDGRGELRWLSRAVDRMDVTAPRFVPAVREIPAVVAERLVVTLVLANELEVALQLPDGADPGQFKVALYGEQAITAAPVADRITQQRHVSAWTVPQLALYAAAPDTYLCAQPDSDGRAVFRALRPGIEIGLHVCGITGDMVYHSGTIAPLAPAERRRIVVSLADRMIVFRGRVVDDAGSPLSRACVQLGGQLLGWTTDDGSFCCYLATPETATLILQHRACATRYVPDYAVPIDGRPVEFRLGAARPVTIEVVDVNGTPMPEAEVWTRYAGFTTNTHRLGGARHVASSTPDAPFELIVNLAGRTYRQPHVPAESSARVVVPLHGRVAAHVASTSTAGRTGRFSLILAPVDVEAGDAISVRRPSADGLRLELPAVHPGTYRASLAYEPSDTERRSGRSRSTSEPVLVTVTGGLDSVLNLALPAGGN
ncbi:MAG: hypothetical protein IPM29_25120 [Planctomycetes bacterium]|nr:hypothetical protein [Planctomycetota bacterium]